jgi:PEGA domain
VKPLFFNTIRETGDGLARAPFPWQRQSEKRRKALKIAKTVFGYPLILTFLLVAGGLQARNQVLGQINFVPANKAAKNSGVWIDGQYVGYLKELKGSKKILLLPGSHQIQVQQSGYIGFSRKVVLEPGEVETVRVFMQKDPGIDYSHDNALLQISGQPDRAAIFIDNQFVGYIDEFKGRWHGMLLTPGKHQIKIALPGYETFETEVDLQPHQKLKLKTNLLHGSVPPHH